ncbi:hypothetical protein KSP40_PGU017110 [Platanthera guangdongensis]|uniref:Uncharacterized protein n=1 Tax=Platanthera guangdongensis TaxID=2320717 RepID=A0ABR2LQM9_9ASPA
MAQAVVATAAVVLSRTSSRPYPLLFFLFSPRPNLSFSTSAHPSNRSNALRPMKPPASGGDRDDNEATEKTIIVAKTSRNELKREARRAVRWGIELATFSPTQIKRILRAASLEREVLDAILLVKIDMYPSRLGPDVREGKRRQFNYIGRLLRKAQPELMDALVQASKEGDTSRLQALTGQKTLFIDDEDSEENEDDLESEEEQDDEKYMEVADRWFDGLVYKDPSITNEVYSVHAVDFDRQELRRLVRRVQSIHEESNVDESGLKSNAVLTKAKKSLILFLHSLAKKSMI